MTDDTHPLRRAVVCALSCWLVASCGATEHGNPEDAPMPMSPPAQPGDFGNYPDATCDRSIWTRPELPLRSYSCSLERLDFGQLADEELPWRCDCDGDVRRAELADGQSCDEVLRQTCGIDSPERNYCVSDGGGVCWPSDAAVDAWDCGCGAPEDAARSALSAHSASSCERAAFAVCARACQDNLGRCEPLAGGLGFACDCEYYPVVRETPLLLCDRALAGCDPSGFSSGESEIVEYTACNTLAGFCDLAPDRARCVCVDGTVHDIDPGELVELSGELCGAVLHERCGDGSEQRAELNCGGETAEGRECHASFDFAAGRYACNCNSFDACNSEYDFYKGSVEAEDCAAALAACQELDAEQAREPIPECTPPSHMSQPCERTTDAGRVCYAAWRRDEAGTYGCQCYSQLDDGPEEDIWDGEVVEAHCEAALERCIALDAMR